MQRSVWLDKFKIVLAFVMLSIVTSGMAVYVLQALNIYHASKLDAGSLESYQNFTSIAIPFVMFSLLIKFGYRKSIALCALILAIYCTIMPFWNNLWAVRVYLILIGISVVLIKISVYSSVSLVVKNKKEHASFLNMIEAIYTLGSVSGMWVFSYFLHNNPEQWMRAFWVFAVICGIVSLLWWFTPFKDINVDTSEQVSIRSQLQNFWPIILTTTSIMFLILLFCSETLEQGVGSWLASFFHEQFIMTAAFSVKLASMLTLSMFVGRVFGAIVLRYVRWDRFFMTSFSIGFVIMAVAIFTLPNGTNIISEWGLTPWNAYALVGIGFFLGPIYPTICSSLLTTQPKKYHAIIMSFIMIFTALFDSISSKLLGVLLYFTDDKIAFLTVVLPPFFIFAFLIYIYYKVVNKNQLLTV